MGFPEPLLMWTDTTEGHTRQLYAMMPVYSEDVHLSPDQKQLWITSGKAACGIWDAHSDIFCSHWDEDYRRWGEACEVPDYATSWRLYCPPDGPGTLPGDGSPSLPADGRTIHYSRWLSDPFGYAICVSCQDSTGVFQRSQRLNLNSYCTLRGMGPHGKPYYWPDGGDAMPAISPDGRMLVFASRRDRTEENWWEDLYVSHLVVDEHGDTAVTESPSQAPPVRFDPGVY